ncbi:MAG: class II glutamine amidotransferase [Candidatus Hodarchaeales archaeon]|jgi:glutamine amidotransferase
MCRLLGIYGKVEIWKNLLREFQKQAETGIILPIKNLEPGHKDGWGFACSRNDQDGMKLVGKHVGNAYNNPVYSKYINEFTSQPQILLGHLRKASPGIKISLRNCHPFITNQWAFIHNGTIYNAETLKYNEKYPFTSNNSDSEFYFHYLLTNLEKNNSNFPPIKSLINSLINLEIGFTSLNCILTNGNSFYVVRFSKKYHSSYTLFCYQDDYGVAFSSEPLITDFLSKKSWIEIQNRSVVEVQEETLEVKIYSF